jgi:RHS repeat-associated protein
VLEERNNANALTVSYLYGDDLISQKRGTDFSYYHYNGQMSTRQLTGSSGSATDNYVYDAFGNPISRTGATINSYLYAGEQQDPNVGAYYLRARYYNPYSGRFTTLDPVSGYPFSAISLHKCLYANENPVMFSDPSGKLTFQQVMVASAVGDALAAIANVEYRHQSEAVRGFRNISTSFRMRTAGIGGGPSVVHGEYSYVTVCENDIMNGPRYCADYDVFKGGIGAGFFLDLGTKTTFSTPSPRSVTSFGGIGGETSFAFLEWGSLTCSIGEIKILGGITLQKSCDLWSNTSASDWRLDHITLFQMASILTYWRLASKPYSVGSSSGGWD